MYKLDDKPKERNLNFLTSYYEKLIQLYKCEDVWDSMNVRREAESFIYYFKDILPDKEKDNDTYFYMLGKLWACHDYLEGDEG